MGRHRRHPDVRIRPRWSDRLADPGRAHPGNRCDRVAWQSVPNRQSPRAAGRLGPVADHDDGGLQFHGGDLPRVLHGGAGAGRCRSGGRRRSGVLAPTREALGTSSPRCGGAGCRRHVFRIARSIRRLHAVAEICRPRRLDRRCTGSAPVESAEHRGAARRAGRGAGRGRPRTRGSGRVRRRHSEQRTLGIDPERRPLLARRVRSRWRYANGPGCGRRRHASRHVEQSGHRAGDAQRSGPHHEPRASGRPSAAERYVRAVRWDGRHGRCRRRSTAGLATER